MGFRLLRPNTAFSNAPVGKQAKRRRIEDKPHLEWLRTLPCVITGRLPVDAAHVRFASTTYGKRATGAGEKPDDKWCVPLCRDKHNEQHSMDEQAFWARHGLDPLRIALALFANSGDDDQGRLIISEANATARTFNRPPTCDVHGGENCTTCGPSAFNRPHGIWPSGNNESGD